MSYFCFYKASAFKTKKNIDEKLRKTHLIDKCCRIFEVFCIITGESDLCPLSYILYFDMLVSHLTLSYTMKQLFNGSKEWKPPYDYHVIRMIVSTHMETINNSRPCGTPCWEDALMENFISLKFLVSLVLGWDGRRQKTRGYCKDEGVFLKSNALTMCEPYQTKV